MTIERPKPIRGVMDEQMSLRLQDAPRMAQQGGSFVRVNMLHDGTEHHDIEGVGQVRETVRSVLNPDVRDFGGQAVFGNALDGDAMKVSIMFHGGHAHTEAGKGDRGRTDSASNVQHCQAVSVRHESLNRSSQRDAEIVWAFGAVDFIFYPCGAFDPSQVAQQVGAVCRLKFKAGRRVRIKRIRFAGNVDFAGLSKVDYFKVGRHVSILG